MRVLASRYRVGSVSNFVFAGKAPPSASDRLPRNWILSRCLAVVVVVVQPLRVSSFVQCPAKGLTSERPSISLRMRPPNESTSSLAR